jgi:hypothetical protein
MDYFFLQPQDPIHVGCHLMIKLRFYTILTFGWEKMSGNPSPQPSGVSKGVPVSTRGLPMAMVTQWRQVRPVVTRGVTVVTSCVPVVNSGVLVVPTHWGVVRDVLAAPNAFSMNMTAHSNALLAPKDNDKFIITGAVLTR